MEANNLAQMASGYQQILDETNVEINYLEPGDWRADIFNYLKNPAQGASKKVRYKALRYVLIGDELFYQTLEDMNLKCLGPAEAEKLMYEVHEGICGTHQAAHKMRWLIRRMGYFWPTLLQDYFKYYKGCQDCQRFGSVQMVPASAMNPIIKPWPFRG